jgi:hypothetical protein
LISTNPIGWTRYWGGGGGNGRRRGVSQPMPTSDTAVAIINKVGLFIAQYSFDNTFQYKLVVDEIKQHRDFKFCAQRFHEIVEVMFQFDYNAGWMVKLSRKQ